MDNNDYIKKNIKKNINELINNGKIHEAEELLNEYFTMVQDDVEAYSTKSVLLVLQEKLLEAEFIIKDGLKYGSDNFDLNYNLAYIYEQQQKYNEALIQYNKALEGCKDESLKLQISNTINKLKIEHGAKIDSPKTRIVFFVKEGMDSFLSDIIEGLSEEYETKKITTKEYKQIDDGMKWADICWFEWCDELVAYGSNHRLAKEKKLICRLHSYEAFTENIQKVNWDDVDKLIFVCNHIRDNVLSKININKNKVEVIYNGINLNKFKFKRRKPGFNIAYIGYINYKKGPMLLLHTFKAIYDIDKRYKLYLAGKFQEERYFLYFKQMASELGLENNIIYSGWQTDVNKWLEDKHYVLSTSVLEGNPLGVMEAMARGIKPLIHNFVGAKAQFGEYVWSSISECVNMINSNEYNSQKYREHIEKNYSLESQIKKIKSLLNNINNKDAIATTKNILKSSKKNIDKVMDIINYFEHKYPVEEWIIENVNIWPVLRNTLYSYLINDGSNRRKSNINIEKCEKDEKNEVKEQICKQLDSEVDVIFLSRTGFRSLVNGVWYSRFCDSISDEFKKTNYKTLALEYLIYDNVYNYPQYSESIHIDRHMNYRMSGINNKKSFNLTYSLKEVDLFIEDLRSIKENENLNIHVFSIEEIFKYYMIIRTIADYFNMIFLKTKPKFGFVSVYQNFYGYGFCLACKESNVISVDIQHGSHLEDAPYARWVKVPTNGFGLLPNIYWCFDENYSNMVNKWAQYTKYHKAIIGGNPWSQMCIMNNRKILNQITDEIKQGYGNFISKNSINVLFTHVSPGNLPNILIDAIKNSTTDINWFIRFHPMTIESEKNKAIYELQSCNNKNIEYEKATNYSLIGMLNICDVHVTTSSSTIIEATDFNIHTISIFNDKLNESLEISSRKQLEEMFNVTYKKNLISFADEYNQLLNMIKTQYNAKKSHNECDKSNLFLSDSIKEIISFRENFNFEEKDNGLKDIEYLETIYTKTREIDISYQVELLLKYKDFNKFKKFYDSITNYKEKEYTKEYLRYFFKINDDTADEIIKKLN